jgi:hypothetical protein
MVRNGDSHKPIWLSELSWNALPSDSDLAPAYGRVSLEQQARYTTLAYQRLQKEWPWLGVGFYWFFKQADDRERGTNPQYYFRMVEPDFTPLPIYDAISRQALQPPVIYAGWHQADHWAVKYRGQWKTVRHQDATFGDALEAAREGDTATFTVSGDSLSLVTVGRQGKIRVKVDDITSVEISPSQTSQQQLVAVGLLPGPRQVSIEVLAAPVIIDGFIVE